MDNNNLLIVDACCLINICASGKLEEIIRGTKFKYLVSRTVNDQEMINTGLLDSLNSHGMKYNDIVDTNLLNVVDFKNDQELEKFFFYAKIIEGDGEAASLAIAEFNNLKLATDDNKAINIAKQHAPKVGILTTPEIIKSWMDTSKPSNKEIMECLQNITKYGHYKPSKKNSLHLWWESILKS